MIPDRDSTPILNSASCDSSSSSSSSFLYLVFVHKREVYPHAGRCTCERAGDHLGVSDLRLRQNLFAICQLSWTQQARGSTSFQSQ